MEYLAEKDSSSSFGKSRLLLSLTLGFAAVLRLWKLGIIPISTVDHPFIERLPYALASIATIYLIYCIGKILFNSEAIGLWSGFWLSVSPWHLVESRTISFVMLGLVVFLLAVLFFLKTKRNSYRFFIFLTFILLLTIIYPQLWIFRKGPTFIFPFVAFSNILKYLSGDFLFFSNDTFWWGGMREMGVLVPIAIIPLIVGIYQLIFYPRKPTKLFIGITFFIFLILAAWSPTNPETKEFFFALPSLALLLGFGSVQIVIFMEKFGTKGKIILGVLFLISSYQLVSMYHTYFIHYALRVQQEITNVKSSF